jgi:hypothetical protein
MRVIARSFFFALCALFVVGCQAPPPNGPTEMVLRIPDRDGFIDATLTLLRERDFPLERVDRKNGVAVTRPSTGKQWFEFWRPDSIGGYQLFESSIHTIRRIVTVHLAPADPENPDEDYRVSVQVDKERYSAPERQVTTASGALAIYSERLPTTEGLLASRIEGEHWVPLGRDPLFEAYLLEQIAGAAAAEAAVIPPKETPQPAPPVDE